MRLYQFVVVMIGILILFNAAGYRPPSSGIIGRMVFGNSSDINSPILSNVEGASLYTTLLTALTVAGGVAIVVGTFVSLPSISYVIAGFLSLFLSLFLVDVLWLYTRVIEHGDTWMVVFMTAIMAPLIIGFIITAVEWWKGGGA